MPNLNLDAVAVAVAWLVLRAVYAWMFLYPSYGLIKDWHGTVQTTALLFPRHTGFFAFGSLVIMILGSLAILLGIYGQLAGVALVGFNLGGALIHYRLARLVRQTHLSASANQADQEALAGVVELGVVGHVTSAEKNFVLAAVALFFALVGTGPLSLDAGLGVFSMITKQ